MSSKDLESEMSKFEAELSKLTSSTFSLPSTTTTTTKPKISIQMPTSFSSQFAMQPPIPRSVSNIPIPPPPPSKPPPPAFNAPQIRPPMGTTPQIGQAQASNIGGGGGVKRDINGRVLNQPGPSGQNKSFNENTGGDDGKHKKGPGVGKQHENNNKPGGGKPKNNKNKVLRSAGGQVWEDPSLTEWDPGMIIY